MSRFLLPRPHTVRATSGKPAALPVLLLAASLAAAGCLGAQPGDEGLPPATPAGVHPYPAQDGSEWPAGLAGPFALRSIESVHVTSVDEVRLHGWVLRPDVPDGVKVPVVLWSAPYFGQCSFLPATSLPPAIPPEYPVCHYDTGDDPALRDSSDPAEAVPVDRLLQEGYAVAAFNVRGTGNSGGCFEWFGPREQQDQAVLVDWLGAQEWSNGRVAMMGLSYHGTTPWEAAIQAPPALKTIVVAGMVSDAYTFSHTPQGATFAISSAFEAHFFWRVSGSPPLNSAPQHLVAHAEPRAERVCPETAEVLSEEVSGTWTDVRNARFWDERRLIDRFPQVTAAVFLTHGFDDNVGSGHQQQENAAWHSLTSAPKRMLMGQWGHMMPDFDPEFESTYGAHWHDVAVEWLDYWLKGLGPAPRLGLAEYQDGTDAWHTSTAWPPAGARDEVLYLTKGVAAPAPGPESASFRSAPGNFPELIPCGDTLPSLGAPGLVYVSDPVAAPTLLAGNPFAYLQVESDLPGGLVAVDLYDLGPQTTCAPTFLGRGVADLRFHDGRFTGRAFPTGTPTAVRVDITDFAEWLDAGDRLGVVVSYGDVADRVGQPYYPTVTLHGDGTPASSHVVLPVVSGSLGGAVPTLDYPPRPFVPPEGQRR